MAPSLELALDCARAVRTRLRLPEGQSPVAIVLGSGLGAFGDALADARSLPFSELPGFPPATVQGHKGRLVLGELEGIPVLAQQGRLHGYEGHDAATVAFPARVLGVLGARALVLTNAAGGVNTGFVQGALMVIDDHINLMGDNPLVGPQERSRDQVPAASPQAGSLPPASARPRLLTIPHCRSRIAPRSIRVAASTTPAGPGDPS